MGAEDSIQRPLSSTRDAGRNGAEAEHGDCREEVAKKGEPRGSRREDRARAQGLRAGFARGHRVSLWRPSGRRSDDPSEPDQSDGAAALAGDVLLWPRAAASAAEAVVG